MIGRAGRTARALRTVVGALGDRVGAGRRRRRRPALSPAQPVDRARTPTLGPGPVPSCQEVAVQLVVAHGRPRPRPARRGRPRRAHRRPGRAASRGRRRSDHAERGPLVVAAARAPGRALVPDVRGGRPTARRRGAARHRAASSSAADSDEDDAWYPHELVGLRAELADGTVVGRGRRPGAPAGAGRARGARAGRRRGAGAVRQGDRARRWTSPAVASWSTRPPGCSPASASRTST